MIKATDLERELEQLSNRYDHAIDHAISLLQQAKGRKASDHLGHNLGNRAAELSALAGKIEQTENMVRWMAEEAK